MKVLFHHNVIASIWEKDDRFLHSFAAYDVCMLRKYHVHIAAHSLPNLEERLATQTSLSREEIRATINQLFDLFSIADITESDCRHACISTIPNMKDALVVACAERNNIDIMIAHNKNAFGLSSVPIMTPEEFVNTYKPANMEYSEESLEA